MPGTVQEILLLATSIYSAHFLSVITEHFETPVDLLK